MIERFKTTYCYRGEGHFKDTITGIEYEITITNQFIDMSNKACLFPDKLVDKIVEGLNRLENESNPQI